MSVAPHEVLCPSNATGTPAISTAGSPSAMTHGECPLSGHTQASPLRATAMPWTGTVPEAATTLPPWLVASPSRIIPFMSFLSKSSRRLFRPSNSECVQICFVPKVLYSAIPQPAPYCKTVSGTEVVHRFAGTISAFGSRYVACLPDTCSRT